MTSPEVDVEDMVIAYLVSQGILSARQISARMPDEITPPFILVQRVAGGGDWLVDRATFDLDTFGADQTSASTIARAAEHALRQLRSKTKVTMPDSSVVVPYSPTEVIQTAVFVPWEPGGGGAVMARYVGRYHINLRLPSIPSF